MLRRRINGLTTFPPLASTRIGSQLPLDPFRNFHGRLYSEGNINGKKEGEQLEIVEKLREWQETAKKNGSERLAIWKSNAEQNLASLGSKLNQLTGYELVEALKRQVVEQEAKIEHAKLASRVAKLAYETAVSERSMGQREVNDLLQRKSSWNDADVIRFTNLVRLDHNNEQAEARAKVEVEQTDSAVEQEFQNLTRAILNRYHEEQVWSDKIRSASTYGSFHRRALQEETNGGDF
ncbi:sensitivity to high expression protein she9 [Serendipita sp. 397]|nr:sensitivity to high expression protein she9 [Serendipita sp. 397]